MVEEFKGVKLTVYGFAQSMNVSSAYEHFDYIIYFGGNESFPATFHFQHSHPTLRQWDILLTIFFNLFNEYWPCKKISERTYFPDSDIFTLYTTWLGRPVSLSALLYSTSIDFITDYLYLLAETKQGQELLFPELL